MASLFDLPLELLERILSDLDIADVSTLSRTCKDARKSLSPRVYHTISWSWEDDHPCPPYHLLLRTLLSKPSLACHVKAINLQGGGIIKNSTWSIDGFVNSSDDWVPTIKARSIWADGQRRRASFNTKDWQRVKMMVSTIALHPGDTRKWLQELYRGNVDAMVALLVRQCQRIERLHIGFGLIHHSVFLHKMFRQLLGTCKTDVVYPHLLSVVLGVDGPIPPWNTDAHFDLFRLFFFLRSLTRFETIFLEPVVFAWPSPTLTPQSHSLSSLVLRKCTASEKILEKLLRCTPNLKHLVYDHCRMVATGEPHYETFKELNEHDRESTTWPKIAIYCHYLSKALTHVKSTLESLEVMIRFQSDLWTEIHDPWNSQYLCCLVGRVKGLDQMPNLKNLEISWALLMGWNINFPHGKDSTEKSDLGTVADVGQFPWSSIFPPKLQKLRLRDDLSCFEHYCHSEIVPEVLLDSLLQVVAYSFRALVRVDFVFTWRWLYEISSWPYDEMERMRHTCQKHGLECDIYKDDRGEVSLVKDPLTLYHDAKAFE